MIGDEDYTIRVEGAVLEDNANEIAAALNYLAESLRGDYSLAGHSTIPDNLAEIVMALRLLPRALDRNFTSEYQRSRPSEQAPANVVDGLFAIARSLDGIAMELMDED